MGLGLGNVLSISKCSISQRIILEAALALFARARGFFILFEKRFPTPSFFFLSGWWQLKKKQNHLSLKCFSLSIVNLTLFHNLLLFLVLNPQSQFIFQVLTHGSDNYFPRDSFYNSPDSLGLTSQLWKSKGVPLTRLSFFLSGCDSSICRLLYISFFF